MGNGTDRDDRSIAAQASEWLFKDKAGNPGERAAFAAWLMTSPRHIAEFLLTTAFHQELSTTELASRGRAIPTSVEFGWTTAPSRSGAKAPPSRRWRRTTILASVSGVLGVVALAAIQLFAPRVSIHSRPRIDHIQFTGQTLAQVADEFNRYNTRKILISDPKIAALRVSGRFSVTDVDTFVTALRGPFGVEAIYPDATASKSSAIRLRKTDPP